MSEALVVPSEIPWDRLIGRELEQLLYWLFDSMGAKELEWRVGGVGGGAADQGRDLEFSFYVASPDGELVRQRWWVEAKGRKGTVEPIEVHKAVLNAAGKSDIDVLVVATNSFFSNPTRDWVRDWQAANPRPLVKLWERTELENHCAKNPSAVLRVTAEALSLQGRLEVAKSKFWDYAALTDAPTLSLLWARRADLEIDALALLALIASESANGDLGQRSWGMFVDSSAARDTLAMAFVNLASLVVRFGEAGVRQEPLIQGLSYLTLVCIRRLGRDVTAILLSSVWDCVDDVEYPAVVRKMLLQPVIRSLQNDVRDVCTSDCRRVSTDPIALSDAEIERYWDRLVVRDVVESKTKDILTIESFTETCKVGFPLDEEVNCPLCGDDEPEDHLLESLGVIAEVLDYRAGADA